MAKVKQPRRFKTKYQDRGMSSDPLPLIKRALDISIQDDGWALLALVGESFVN
jgi:hypothetical protein